MKEKQDQRNTEKPRKSRKRNTFLKDLKLFTKTFGGMSPKEIEMMSVSYDLSQELILLRRKLVIIIDVEE